MMKPLWVIQTNLVSAVHTKELADALASHNTQWMSIKTIPFSDHTPDEVPSDRPVIFYGATTLIANVHRSNKWIPGVFLDEELLSFEKYLHHYGSRMLNGDAEVCVIEELALRDFPDEHALFVRAVLDDKSLAGNVMTFAEFKVWHESLKAGGYQVTPTDRIVVASPKEIAREWRLFVVDRKIVAGSRYRSYGVIDPVCEMPPEVVEFANEAVSTWCPLPAFAIDICWAEDYGYKNIELGCINSCGFYAADQKAITASVTRLAEELYA